MNTKKPEDFEFFQRLMTKNRYERKQGPARHFLEKRQGEGFDGKIFEKNNNKGRV